MAYKVPTVASRYYDDLVAQLPSLEGKSFVVTGTTSGTGKVAAVTFAQAGAQVLMLNRAVCARRRHPGSARRALWGGERPHAGLRPPKLRLGPRAASQVRDVCAGPACSRAGEQRRRHGDARRGDR